MFKKLIAITATTVFVGVLLFGRDVASYLTTSAGRLRETVRSQVPVEFELERAERMISDLTPQIRKNMHALAREEIQIERLSDKVKALENRQANGKVSLTRLQQELDSGRGEIQLGSTRYTSLEAERLAETRFERYKIDEVTLGLLRRTRSVRQSALESARKQLDAMMAAEQQLLAEVASLKARQMMNEVARTTRDFTFDDSHLTRTRDLIQEIEARIQVDERMAEVESEFVDGLLQTDSEQRDDIAGRISEYFGDALVLETNEPAATTLAESLP